MTSKSIIVKWAAIGSIAYLVVGVIGHLISIQTSGFMSFLFGILIAFPILMASFDFRDKYNGSFATLPQIFIQGIKITFLLAIVAASWSLVYASVINEKYIEDVRFKNKIELMEMGFEEAQIDEDNALADEKRSPVYSLVLIKFINAIIFGIFVSLVAGLVIRNEKPRPELNHEEA